MFSLKSTTNILFVGLLSFSTLISCSSSETESKSSAENVTDLVTRGEKIQLGKEWDEVQNNFAKYKAEIAKDKHNNEAKLNLAQLYIREARVTGEHGHYYPAALAIIDDALNDPKIEDDLRFMALTTKAGVQLSLHDFKDALTTGNAAALLNPANAQIHGVLVDANVEQGNYAKAVMLSDRMLQIKPDIRSYSRASYLREIHGDVDGSIEAMTLAVKAGYPGTEETAWAMQTLGDIYKEYGMLDKAENVYKQILDMRKDYPFAVGALGDVQMERGDLEEAEQTLKRAMGIIPEVGFYISMANLYKEQGRTDDMKKMVDDIMVMLKEDTDSGHNMDMEFADLYLTTLDDPAKALEYAEMEYAKRPNNIDVNRMLARIHLAAGEKAKAAKHYEAALVTGSKNPELAEIKVML